jgi:hypothetical protein
VRRRGWTMAWWRSVAVGLVLVAVGACTRPPSPQGWADLSAPPVPVFAATRSPDPDPAPWTRLVRVSAADPMMVDPFAALLRSSADRRRWARQVPTDYATLVWKPGGLASAGAPPGETGRPQTPSPDSQVVLSRLEKALSVSVKPICRGC